MTRQELINQILNKRSYLCVGLDTDPTKLPKHLQQGTDRLFDFNKAIVDATKDFCVAYKINTAFYEAHGSKGWESMERIVNYIPSTHFKIADAKRGDIGNTSAQYAKAFFETLNFDAITVAPYMGEDSVKPFLEHKDKWTILLGLTSNEGAKDFELQKLVRRTKAHMREVPALDLGLAAVPSEGSSDLDDRSDQASARWFNLSLGFEVDGERVNLLPWLPQLLDHISRGTTTPDDRLWLHAEPDQWWHVPVAPLRPWLATMLELVGERQHELRRGEELRLNRFEAMRLAAADASRGSLALSGLQANALGNMVQALKESGGIQEVTIPEGLHAELRPYQRHGLAWLQFLAQHQLGGVLADDMGLGKTLQTIAHLWVEKQAGRLQHPALVVAPTSLVGNWRSELNRFAPGLRTLVLHGAQRSGQFDTVPDSDVVITTYPLLSRDHEVLVAQPWSVVVLDEAQTIKNAKTQAAGVVQSLDARQRLCLSGTPMENHLGEIWSLFNFLMPGYLGNEARFRQLFRTPIEKHGDAERLKVLRARLAPFMLRRTKALVASELPPKVEVIEHVTLAPSQAKLYEAIRLTTEQKVREALSSKGLARSHITVLDALLKLRQVCCDPRLVPLAAAAKVKQSAKLDWLVQNLPEMIAEGRRVLLFSQFTSMLALIEEELPALGLNWVKLTGQSTGREALIERFTSGEVPLFLISLKAGGVGLNLPQADTVIHYDPWWNPAAEDQATDRAHRMGQTQTVFVHKLVAEGTLEERILALQARKADLARGLHGDAGASGAALTETDLDWLLQPLGAGLTDLPLAETT